MVMNAKKMLLSFAPWVLFSVLVSRRGVDIVGPVALGAGALSLFFILKDKTSGGVKVIDATSCATFAVLGLIGTVGDHAVRVDITNYGRGIAAFVLGAVMTASVAVFPFTEQYARESVPQAYWSSPLFRAVNRKISAAFGFAIFVMGCGHLFAGHYDPASAPISSRRPVELLLNWVVPALVVGAAALYTKKLTSTETATAVAR
jgi:hypothetical protein